MLLSGTLGPRSLLLSVRLFEQPTIPETTLMIPSCSFPSSLVALRKHLSPTSCSLLLTSNLLCLNCAKTEFIWLDLKPQLNKIHKSYNFFSVNKTAKINTKTLQFNKYCKGLPVKASKQQKSFWGRHSICECLHCPYKTSFPDHP